MHANDDEDCAIIVVKIQWIAIALGMHCRRFATVAFHWQAESPFLVTFHFQMTTNIPTNDGLTYNGRH